MLEQLLGVSKRGGRKGLDPSLTANMCGAVRILQSLALQLSELERELLGGHTARADKGFGKPQEREKIPPMCDPAYQTNFLIVEQPTALCSCVFFVVVVFFPSSQTKECTNNVLQESCHKLHQRGNKTGQ